MCHGLAGYFESVLYPGIELSTNPNTMDAKSKGMISWFPIFFPLKVGLVFANFALASDFRSGDLHLARVMLTVLNIDTAIFS